MRHHHGTRDGRAPAQVHAARGSPAPAPKSSPKPAPKVTPRPAPKPEAGDAQAARAAQKAPSDVVVDGYSERWVRRGFPWVYPKEVRAGELRAGAEVVVRAMSGEALGRGIADAAGRWLAVRLFRHDTGPLDHAFFAARVAEAQALRDTVIDAGTTGYRVVNAENDGLPGIRIDRWGEHLVLALDTPALRGLVDPLVAALAQRFAPQSIHLCYRPDARDAGALGAVPDPTLVHGTAPTEPVIVRERGLKFGVLPAEGPDVGLYADMRATRAWLEPHWKGTRVLNTFAYTGAFSVAAAAHGAARVVTVDLSEKYLARAKANFVLNDLEIDEAEFVPDDVFRAFDRLRRKGEMFDRVIVDPPSFSHSEEGKWSVEKDYPRLVAAACRVLGPGGWLIAASNLGELSPHKFREPLDEGIRRAGRQAQELFFGGQSPDFPAAMWVPEGRYLKVGVWRILGAAEGA